jgi:hypothetical protein
MANNMPTARNPIITDTMVEVFPTSKFNPRKTSTIGQNRIRIMGFAIDTISKLPNNQIIPTPINNIGQNKERCRRIWFIPAPFFGEYLIKYTHAPF